MKPSPRLPGSVLALATAAVLALVAGPARAEGEGGKGPCDALVDYLRGALAGPEPASPGVLFDLGYSLRESHLEDRLRSTSSTMPSAYTARVTPACRAETRRGAAPAATEAAREWTARPERGWIDRGRIFRCTMQDPEAYIELAAWMTDAFHPDARAVCASALATWPEGNLIRGPILARAVRKAPGWATWEIDEAVVAAANVMGTPELREQLVPVVAAAHASHTLGSDRLRAAVCTNDGAMSDARARTCSASSAEAEREWRRSERPGRWVARGGATALYAWAIAASVERDHAAGRDIATTAGVLGGAVAGVAVLAGVAVARRYPRSESDEGELEARILGSLLAGGVLGGLAAHAIAASPGARTPVTAVALAPFYLSIIAVTID